MLVYHSFSLLLETVRDSVSIQEKPMEGVLYAWFASMAVCAFYTFGLPIWDSFQARKSDKPVLKQNLEMTSSRDPARPTA